VIETLKKTCKQFGLEIMHAGIKDIVLPGEIRDIMNQVLIAEKKAQVIMRREETASTRSLLNTAKLMEENVVLSHLKELEYLERIAEKITTISLSGKTR
jgi:regulator of protease activity HflC (stomatin/prohibitin superfamily)